MVSSVTPRCGKNHARVQYAGHLKVENACHLVQQLCTPLKITEIWSLLLPYAYGYKIYLICCFREDC